jgi:two-component system, OmpR family, sensor histidine kinase MprB
MSFRLRITLASAAAVALAVALASAIAYVLVQDQLRGEVDTSLRQRAEAIAEQPFELQRFFGRVPQPAIGGAPGYLQLVSGTGQVVRPDYEPVLLPFGKRAVQVAKGQTGEFFNDAHVGKTHVRVITFQIDPASQVALQIALSLRSTDDVLGRLQWILFTIGAGGIGLAVLFGWLVARAALAPVRRLTTATEEITATRDLSRRVEAYDRDELGRLGKSFNTMLAALEESQQAQRQLVADASHELRTPLTSLRTNVELLARGGLPDEERGKALADVSTQLEELTVLVTDVVDLARDGEREHTVEDVRLDLLVSDAVERSQLHAPGVDFRTDLAPSLVRGVPERIFRAVANVLDNAAKWSPPGGTVEVKTAEGEISVRDHGPGIAPEDLPHVFDRFYRSPAARGTPGSGLGLAIVRQVVESHGGTVWAGPADGGGTVVRLSFPAVRDGSELLGESQSPLRLA